jgi:hypothetical protein
MKTELDIMVTAGLWPRLLGGACTEIMKHEATKHCVKRLRVWAWDTDNRGVNGLVPEPLYAAPACLRARNEAQKLIANLHEQKKAGKTVLPDMGASLEKSLGPVKSDAPLLALATLTSQKTFKCTLELLQNIERPILLFALADFPQDSMSAEDLRNRVEEGFGLINSWLPQTPKLTPVIFSRGAFVGDEGVMDDVAKELFMKCTQHILWLLCTHDDPVSLLQSWHEKMRADRFARWSLGHLQLDCSGSKRGNPILAHTLMSEPEQCPYEWKGGPGRGEVVISAHNHLGIKSDSCKTITVAVHVFSEPGRSPEVGVPGIAVAPHDTYLVDRIDMVFLNRIKSSVP